MNNKPNNLSDFPIDNDDFVKQVKKTEGKHKLKKRLRVFGIVLAVAVSLGIAGYFVYDQAFDIKDYTVTENTEEIIITIARGETVSSIADDLFSNGVIMSQKAFINAAKKTNRSIPAGTFRLYKHMRAMDALNALDQSNVATHKLTVTEGKTVKQIAKDLGELFNATSDVVLVALDNLKSELLPEGVDSFEGWLFPATYEFEYDSSLDAAIRQMVEHTKKVLEDNNVAESDYETVLTKASIIQLEVRSQDDMRKAARVIDNRLAIDMKLAMDSIIAYGVNKGDGTTQLELMQTDLDDPSNPYNSRLNAGLPPTPISNPGSDAIMAVVNPEPGDWLYWVTVDPSTGQTVFLNTEEEFNEARDDYKSWCNAHKDECGLTD